MEAIEKYVLPAIVALVSWLIKDFLVGLNVKRSEALRREWEFRLKDVWSPLYFWSGIVLFEGSKKGWDKHGISELEKVLARSTHLIPQKHFYTLIRMIETASGQSTPRPAIDEIQQARAFIYNQIEVLNYLLYRKSGLDDVSAATNILHPYRQLTRLIVRGAVHLTIWVAVAGSILGIYRLYTLEYYRSLVAIVLLVAISVTIFVVVDVRKRRDIEKEIRKRLGAA